MRKIEIVNFDQDALIYVKKAIGIVLIILGLILIFEYILHALKILMAIILFAIGGYLISNQGKLKWFRFRRF